MAKKINALKFNPNLKDFQSDDGLKNLHVKVETEDMDKLDQLAKLANVKNRTDIIRWLIREAYKQNFSV